MKFDPCMNRCRVGGKEDVCLPECPDVCYIMPVTFVNNINISWPGTVKSSLHSISTCNIPLIQNDPGRSSFLTMRASPGFEPASPDWETNVLPTRPNCLPYHHNFSRVDIESNPSLHSKPHGRSVLPVRLTTTQC